MRRITLWLMSTLAAVVLLFSYRTSTMAVPAGGSKAPDTTKAGNTTTSTATTNTGPANTGTAHTADGTTYKGSVASTRWGDVQVSISVAAGRITGVTVPVYPNDNRKDQQINARALPILNKETVAAQSADIDAVSGATVTSNGYKESLQSALDAAHLG